MFLRRDGEKSTVSGPEGNTTAVCQNIEGRAQCDTHFKTEDRMNFQDRSVDQKLVRSAELQLSGGTLVLEICGCSKP